MQILDNIACILEGLPDKSRRAFLLNRLDGLMYSEIAKVLSVSSSMVKQYMASVLVHCYKALQGSGHLS
ncbi:MAG TPA: sigma factor-like helix-turn-helix DNA-binding protein [Pseudomonas sp.]